jgi:hypothetical protein
MGRVVGLCALVGLFGMLASASAATPEAPTLNELTAMYVIDHNGGQPASRAALAAYVQPFKKILAGCRILPDDLTNLALQLAEKSSYVGGRNVTSLQMLQAIARRITWPSSDPHGCGYIYNLAEAHMETGGP